MVLHTDLEKKANLCTDCIFKKTTYESKSTDKEARLLHKLQQLEATNIVKRVKRSYSQAKVAERNDALINDLKKVYHGVNANADMDIKDKNARLEDIKKDIRLLLAAKTVSKSKSAKVLNTFKDKVAALEDQVGYEIDNEANLAIDKIKPPAKRRKPNPTQANPKAKPTQAVVSPVPSQPSNSEDDDMDVDDLRDNVVSDAIQDNSPLSPSQEIARQLASNHLV